MTTSDDHDEVPSGTTPEEPKLRGTAAADTKLGHLAERRSSDRQANEDMDTPDMPSAREAQNTLDTPTDTSDDTPE